LGVWPSPYYLNGYIHIEARDATASIKIEDGVWLNNNAVIIAERSSISIGANTLIGTEFTVYDSDFHDLQPERRMSGIHECSSVSIGENVFIGSRVMVMKGVVIGDNSVIASGAVVTHSVPANCIAGGVPAQVIRYLKIDER
jgi:maltose O-acetyltransferase